MKTTKRIFIAFLFLAVGIVAVQAQRPQKRHFDPEKRAERMTQRMTEHLSLTEEQAAQVKAIHLKYAKQMQTVMEQNEERPARSEMQKFREAQMAEIEPLLNEEQLAKWQEFKKDRKGKQGKGPRGMGMGPDFDPQEKAERMTQHMAEALELSDEQVEEVKAIHLSAAEKMKAFHEQNDGERQAMRGEMKKLRDETKAELQKVLTDEQYEKWEEMRPKHPQGRKGKGGMRKGADERM